MEQGQDIMGQMDDELSTIFCMTQFGTLFQVALHPIITIYMFDGSCMECGSCVVVCRMEHNV